MPLRGQCTLLGNSRKNIKRSLQNANDQPPCRVLQHHVLVIDSSRKVSVHRSGILSRPHAPGRASQLTAVYAALPSSGVRSTSPGPCRVAQRARNVARRWCLHGLILDALGNHSVLSARCPTSLRGFVPTSSERLGNQRRVESESPRQLEQPTGNDDSYRTRRSLNRAIRVSPGAWHVSSSVFSVTFCT